MNSYEYVMYYREKIWSYAVLACRAQQFKKWTQLDKYKLEMNKMIEGLEQLLTQEKVR